MNTSYFARSGTNPEAVAICRFPPKWFPDIKHYPKLAPSAKLLREYKAGGVSKSTYVQRYTEETLNNLDPDEVISELGDCAIMCCYETPDKFCHRHLVVSWLNKQLGLDIKEI